MDHTEKAVGTKQTQARPWKSITQHQQQEGGPGRTRRHKARACIFTERNETISVTTGSWGKGNGWDEQKEKQQVRLKCVGAEVKHELGMFTMTMTSWPENFIKAIPISVQWLGRMLLVYHFKKKWHMAFFILTKYTLQSLRKKRFITTTKPKKQQTVHAKIISKFMVHCFVWFDPVFA